MRNIAKNTRRATALTLAAALAVACYLNWQYARTDLDTLAVETAAPAASDSAPSASSGQQNPSGGVTDALLTEAEAASAAGKNYGEAQLVSVANDTGSQFFDEARLNREKAHDEALDTIQKTLKQPQSSYFQGRSDINQPNYQERPHRSQGKLPYHILEIHRLRTGDKK